VDAIGCFAPLDQEVMAPQRPKRAAVPVDEVIDVIDEDEDGKIDLSCVQDGRVSAFKNPSPYLGNSVIVQPVREIPCAGIGRVSVKAAGHRPEDLIALYDNAHCAFSAHYDEW
jgi:hypothetical protein